MKKLFFFRSSTDKQVCVEHSSKGDTIDQTSKKDECCSESLRHSLLNSRKTTYEDQNLCNNSTLRRSRSFSSAAFLGDTNTNRSYPCLSDTCSPPSSSDSLKAEQHSHSYRGCPGTPDRHVKTKKSREFYHGGQKPSYSQLHDDCSESSLSSSNLSNDVLDLYIDGEQQNERSRRKSSRKDQIINGGDKKPPRYHFTATASPTGSVKDKPKSHSTRLERRSQLNFSSKSGQNEGGFGQVSPRDLAKHVAERLCQTDTNFTEYDSTVPITIEDVYNESLNGNVGLNSEMTHHKEFQSERKYASANRYHIGEHPDYEQNSDVTFNADAEDELDIELKSKLKEAQERMLFLSEELEQESFLRDVEFNLPSLVQRIKSLTEEKVTLTLEVSAILESQIADRDSLKEQLKSARLELESRTRKLEEEKNEMQLALEKELDRRSTDWSANMEKCQVEEQRLRERVRELAEQNVSLQREVSSLSESEAERRNMISFSEKQIRDLSSMLEATQRENKDLRESLSELQDKFKEAEENRSFMQKSYGEKEEECKGLHTSITRLLRTCTQQEKTIDGLRGELDELVQRTYSVESYDKNVRKLQIEQIRLTGIERALRKEVESFKLEADSLRHENVNLLNRLKAYGKEGGSLTFKLDHELWARVQCLQKQGLLLLKESTNLCSRLIESIKREGKGVEKMDGMDPNASCFDLQFVIDSEVKVQGFRRGAENLVRSLQNITKILDERSSIFAQESMSNCQDSDGFRPFNECNSLDLRSEMKAEKLLTSLLREKLHFKDQEIEQLEAEVATAARGIDILRCEVQNALDSLSCATHKMKELELQTIKKEERTNQLQVDLQESMRELTRIRGQMPKMTEQRDRMWEEVKQYTEENMLLNKEMNMLKKKIEQLDEDVLVKEGEITILKDSLASKSFDLLASPDRIHEYLLE